MRPQKCIYPPAVWYQSFHPAAPGDALLEQNIRLTGPTGTAMSSPGMTGGKGEAGRTLMAARIRPGMWSPTGFIHDQCFAGGLHRPALRVTPHDQQRSHFQKWLLIRLGWVNSVSAMTNASAIEEKIVNDEGLSDSRAYFQLAVLDNWMKTDLPGAFSWVCQMPDTDSRQRALKKIICWVQSLPDSDSKNKALETCIGELAKTDVPKALALAESLPEKAWRSTVITRIWMKTDPFAVWDWINSLNLPPDIMQPRKATWP